MTFDRSHRDCFALTLLMFVVLEPSFVFAQFSDGATDRDAVRRGTNSVWVEGQTDSLAVPSDQLTRSDVSDRHDSIRKNSNAKSFWERLFGSSGTGAGTGNSMFNDFFDSILEIWRLLLMLAIGVVIGVAIYFIAKSNGFQGFRNRNQKQVNVEDLEQQRAKISDLPFELEQPLMGLRATAERYRIAGDYSKATMYLYSYLLVELDHAHCIRLERGKTNGVYIRETRSQPELYEYLSQTVRLFELTFFGRHPISRDAFESLWNRLGNIEGTLRVARDGKSREGVGAPRAAFTEAGA